MALSLIALTGVLATGSLALSAEEATSGSSSLWANLPAIITALAALVTAVAALRKDRAPRDRRLSKSERAELRRLRKVLAEEREEAL